MSDSRDKNFTFPSPVTTHTSITEARDAGADALNMRKSLDAVVGQAADLAPVVNNDDVKRAAIRRHIIGDIRAMRRQAFAVGSQGALQGAVWTAVAVGGFKMFKTIVDDAKRR